MDMPQGGTGQDGQVEDGGAGEDESNEPAPKAIIEIYIEADGTFEVSLETGEQESAEQNGGGEAAGSQPVPAKNLEDALNIARQMAKSALSSPDEAAANAKAAQSQGYQQP